MPDWDAIRAAWPLIIGGAVVWARLEVALAGTKRQSEFNAGELSKLEMKVDAQDKAAQAQAVQLATIVANTASMKETLDRVARKLEG